MAAMSKLYSDIMKSNNVTCAHVLHPDSSCSYFLVKTLFTTIFRVSQFFVPLYFLPMLANYKNLTKEKLFDVLEIFVSSVLTGGATVYIAFLMICFLSNVFGTSSFWKLIPIPAAVGGLTIYFATERVEGFFCHATAMVVFDMLIRDGSLWPMRLLRTHKSLRTLLFMVLSGIIVDTMYLNSDSMFWLFKPLKKYRKPINGGYANGSNGINGVDRVNGVNGVHNGIKSITGSHVCHHKDSCNSHILQVFKTYLILGVALEMLKFVFGNFGAILANPVIGLARAIKNIKPNFLLFITGYPTLTNIINCLLNGWLQKSTRLNQDIAAFIGGLPFYFCAGELPLLAHSSMMAIESVWHRYKKYSDPNTKTYQWLTKIPFSKLVYIFGGSFMYTSRLFFPWLAPKFLQRLMMLITDCKFDLIGERVHSIWIPKAII